MKTTVKAGGRGRDSTLAEDGRCGAVGGDGWGDEQAVGQLHTVVWRQCGPPA